MEDGGGCVFLVEDQTIEGQMCLSDLEQWKEENETEMY